VGVTAEEGLVAATTLGLRECECSGGDTAGGAGVLGGKDVEGVSPCVLVRCACMCSMCIYLGVDACRTFRRWSNFRQVTRPHFRLTLSYLS